MAECHECRGKGCLADGPVCRVCKGSGENGVDLSINKGRDQQIAREIAPKLCMKRVGNGVWCQLAHDHGDGVACSSHAEPIYGPIEARPPLWRDRRGMQEPAENKPAKIAEPSADLIK
jgi:hypothetical protein